MGSGGFGVRNSGRRGRAAVAGVMRCGPATRTFEQDRASGCRMWPIFGSQIGNVGLDNSLVPIRRRLRFSETHSRELFRSI